MKSLFDLIIKWRQMEEIVPGLNYGPGSVINICCNDLFPYAERAEGDEDLIRRLTNALDINENSRDDLIIVEARRRLGQG